MERECSGRVHTRSKECFIVDSQKESPAATPGFPRSAKKSLTC
jgi:hypothetical protein